MKTLLIHGGHVIDPAQDIDRPADLLISDDQIVGVVEPGSVEQADERLDATGLLVMPGLIDTQVHIREPGHEKSETIHTAARAAIAGGFTTILATPDTEPPIDNEAAAEYVFLQAQRANFANVFPMGCLTKNRAGEELAEIGQLSQAGALAFSDGDRAVSKASLFAKALRYASMFDKPVIEPSVEPSLSTGVMHAGFHAIRLGMPGIPEAAEEVLIARDTILARDAGAHVHVACVASRGGTELLRRAKNDGIRVTASVTPHHLTLTDDLVEQYDAAAHKVMPPLRTEEHIEALLAGLADGTIDAITSDHFPQPLEDKVREFDMAPFGVIGLETTLAVLYTHLVVPGRLSMTRLVELLATKPAEIMRLDLKRSLSRGSDADVLLFDPAARWRVDHKAFHSKSRNTPFHGKELQGRPRYAVVMGRVLPCQDDV